ncbi:unnamed protein product, partial [Symbiodinium sp. KB8]
DTPPFKWGTEAVRTSTVDKVGVGEDSGLCHGHELVIIGQSPPVGPLPAEQKPVEDLEGEFVVGAVQQDVHLQLYISVESADRTALVQGGSIPSMKNLKSLEVVHLHPGGPVIGADPEEGVHPVWQW